MSDTVIICKECLGGYADTMIDGATGLCVFCLGGDIEIDIERGTADIARDGRIMTREQCEKILKRDIILEPPVLGGSNSTVLALKDGEYVLDGTWNAEEIMAIAVWINAGWPIDT